jgi:hypothetical protein
MVRRLLQLPALPGKDAADALGIAISHAHVGSSFAAMRPGHVAAKAPARAVPKGRSTDAACLPIRGQQKGLGASPEAKRTWFGETQE